MARDCTTWADTIRRLHPVKLAASFGGLLTQPSLQSNCLRLEALVHLSIALANGPHDRTTDTIAQGFSDVGQAYGHLEDPPEDVFVGNIASKRGNYLVLEGIGESSTYYLQRFINLVDTLPDEAYFNEIAQSVHSLLKLSDLICRRAGLQRNVRGSDSGFDTLPDLLAQRFIEFQDLVRFEIAELSEAGIDPDSLDSFIFDAESRSSLLLQKLTHTSLERSPLAFLDEHLYVVLPTVISPAIRRFFIKKLGSDQNRQALQRHLAVEYSQQFQRSPFLGYVREPFPFFHGDWGAISCMTLMVDHGRYLACAFVVGSLEGFEDGGFTSPVDEFVQGAVRDFSRRSSDAERL